jgi:Xaa-Pro aminopeptidase
MMTHAETIYINTNEHYRAAVETETREARFVKWWKDNIQHIPSQKQPNFTTHSFCKESEELDLIQQACTITEKGFRRVLSSETNVMEYEIEAEFIHEFMRNRSKGFPTRQLLVQETMLMYCTMLKITNNVNPVI